ncbi:MAG TPA: hypothetical protein VGL68_03810 [Solirubrobacteraceae bacterium]|jgi:hypothetical protein
MSIKYTGSDGRSYPDMTSMIRAGFDEVLKDQYEAIERAIRRPTCSVHHRKASVRRTGFADKVRFQIGACCEQLKAQAEAAAAQVFRA